MKKSFLTIVCTIFALGLWASPVTSEMAKLAANNWVAQNAKLGAGEAMAAVEVKDADGQTLWWTVTMSTGGAVFVAPDDGIEPIIASTKKFSADKFTKRNPLWALLSRDLRARRKVIASKALTASGSGARLMSVAAPSAAAEKDAVDKSIDAAKAKWQRLTVKRGGAKLQGVAVPEPSGCVYIVEGFEEGGALTYWNQSDSDYSSDEDGKLFNLYTPKNYVCGCVATAGAALLQYYNVLKAPKLVRLCTVDGNKEYFATSGVDYDWAALPEELGGEGSFDDPDEMKLTEDQMATIGHAAADMGICLKMQYSENGSGTYTKLMASALVNDFGVTSAQWIQSPEIEDYGAYIYDEVTNGYPVALSIHGQSFGEDYVSYDEGHCVLGVGYAEDDEQTAYTRIFLGWGGAFDGWYALPSIVVDYGGHGIDWDILQGIVTGIRNYSTKAAMLHNTFAKLKVAALATDPVRPMLMISGSIEDDENAAELLAYIQTNYEQLTNSFEIGWTRSEMSDGDQGLGVSFGIFNPYAMQPEDRWLASNGRLAFAEMSATNTWDEVLEAFENVLAEGPSEYEKKLFDISLEVACGPMGESDLAKSVWAQAFSPACWKAVDAQYVDGQEITASCPTLVTNKEETIVMACSGWSLTDATGEVVKEGSGAEAQFTVSAEGHYKLAWQFATNQVKIVVSTTDEDRWGTVEPGTGWYPFGESVLFTATPGSRGSFSAFSTVGTVENVIDAGYSIAWVAERPVVLTANFNRNSTETPPLYDTFCTLSVSSEFKKGKVWDPTVPEGFTAPKTLIKGLKNVDISIEDGASESVPATNVLALTESVSVEAEDGSIWKCQGWKTVVGGTTNEFVSASALAGAALTVSDDLELTWRWVKVSEVEPPPPPPPSKFVISWNKDFTNLSEDGNLFKTNLMTVSQLEATGQELEDLDVETPLGWKPALTEEDGFVVARVELDEEVLAPKSADDGSPLTILTNADGSLSVQASVANGVQGFWYSFYASNDLVDWQLVSKIQLGIDGTYSKQALETGAIKLEIKMTPEDAKKFYKLVVTSKDPSQN